MHRFFLSGVSLLVGRPVDLSPLAHQLHRVLRLAVGTQIVLLDNSGNEFVTQITTGEHNAAAGVVMEQRPARGEPAVHITLFQCSLKADKFEWVLQKGTELGVSCFAPVISERSVVRPAAALSRKYVRWRDILREAAEQSGRGRIPQLLAPLEWREAVTSAVGVRLVAWESMANSAASLQFSPFNPRFPISLAIGPEGGLTGAEIDLAQSSGWQVISLGRRILRAETAALAAVTVLMERSGELGSIWPGDSL